MGHDRLPPELPGLEAVTLVTGVNGCIGSALAQSRTGAGQAVLGVDLGPARWTSNRYRHFQCDLGQADGLEALLAYIESTSLFVRAFVNCAGIYERREPHALAYSDIMRTLAINVAAYVHLGTRLAGRSIVPGGHIVGIASDAYVLGPRRGIHYAASKGAVVSATYAMARAFAKRPVMVNCIVPGVIDSPQAELDADPTRRREFESDIPLGRVGRAEDVVLVINAITSGAFDYCTGQKFAVNGGRDLL